MVADDEYDLKLGTALYDGLKERLATVSSCKGPLRTYATVSGAIDGYASANAGSNSLAATAHQNLVHLTEEHPEFARCPQPDPFDPLDFYACGGKRSLGGEFEYGGRRRQADDRKKVARRPPNEDKLFVNSISSLKASGQDDETYKTLSFDGGAYFHGELYQRKNDPPSKATLRLKGYRSGQVFFDSKFLDEERAFKCPNVSDK